MGLQSAAQSAATREVPARVIPVPDTVSPQMQAVIAQQLDPKFNIAPETTAEWKMRVEDAAAVTVQGLPRLREALGVTAELISMAGVKAFTVTPEWNGRATATASCCTCTVGSGC